MKTWKTKNLLLMILSAVLILTTIQDSEATTGTLALSGQNSSVHYKVGASEGDFSCTSGSTIIAFELNTTPTVSECRQHLNLTCPEPKINYVDLSTTLENTTFYQKCVSEIENRTSEFASLKDQKADAERERDTNLRENTNLRKEVETLSRNEPYYIYLVIALTIALLAVAFARQIIPLALGGGRREY